MRRLPPLPLEPTRRGQAAGRSLSACPLCGREMIAGASVDLHHLVPKSRGGTQAVQMHRICHRRIYAEFSEAELARNYGTVEALRAHPAIDAFIRWIAGKPATFTKATFKRKGGS